MRGEGGGKARGGTSSGAARPRCIGGGRRHDGWGECWGGVEDALTPKIGDGRS
jgi:hypothetical protein